MSSQASEMDFWKQNNTKANSLPVSQNTRETTPKPKPSFSTPDASFVDIIVGSPPQTFQIHKELISYHSPFFKAAFESAMFEGQTQSMRLEDVDPKAFGQFVYWLYTERLEIRDQMKCRRRVTFPLDEKTTTTNMANQELPDVVLIGRIWVLAGRFLMPRFQNKIMTILYDLDLEDRATEAEMRVNHIADLANFAYELDGADKLKMLATDLIACTGIVDKDVPSLPAWVTALPKEAILEVMTTWGQHWHSGQQPADVLQSLEMYLTKE